MQRKVASKYTIQRSQKIIALKNINEPNFSFLANLGISPRLYGDKHNMQNYSNKYYCSSGKRPL